MSHPKLEDTKTVRLRISTLDKLIEYQRRRGFKKLTDAATAALEEFLNNTAPGQARGGVRERSASSRDGNCERILPP